MGWTMPLMAAKIFVFAGVPVIYETLNSNHWWIFSSLYDSHELNEK